eukprot:TRINITY_DN3038_c0_g1_i11.p1 TRINITY_DN3038_c0_g1~~TRINITY_DN3038_c0_g1_i11.p1  ORF type:complete len:131 (+),score=6.75 TRINITY_DN3038_c0_g1_i11:365-757(+)
MGTITCENCQTEHDLNDFIRKVRENIKDIYNIDPSAPTTSTEIKCVTCNEPSLKPKTVLYGVLKLVGSTTVPTTVPQPACPIITENITSTWTATTTITKLSLPLPLSLPSHPPLHHHNHHHPRSIQNLLK